MEERTHPGHQLPRRHLVGGFHGQHLGLEVFEGFECVGQTVFCFRGAKDDELLRLMWPDRVDHTLEKVFFLPVAAFLGRPAQVAAVVHHADAAIVGSAIVRLIESLDGDPELVSTVGAFIGSLKAATRAAATENGGGSGG